MTLPITMTSDADDPRATRLASRMVRVDEYRCAIVGLTLELRRVARGKEERRELSAESAEYVLRLLDEHAAGLDLGDD